MGDLHRMHDIEFDDDVTAVSWTSKALQIKNKFSEEQRHQEHHSNNKMGPYQILKDAPA